MAMRVLIADDHAVLRRGLMEILAEEFAGIEFGEAGSGPEVLQRVRRERWDAVILDITMPDMSGLDALKDIAGAFPRLPVLVLSMHPEEQYAVRALRAGAAGYLTKETAPEKLVEAMRKALAGGKYVSPSLAEKLACNLRDKSDRPPHEALSDREYQVMMMIAGGKTVCQIAECLCLSVKTVSTYRSRVLAKMKMTTSAELMRYALKERLVGLD